MSRIGARKKREKLAETKAARRLIADLCREIPTQEKTTTSAPARDASPDRTLVSLATAVGIALLLIVAILMSGCSAGPDAGPTLVFAILMLCMVLVTEHEGKDPYPWRRS